MLTISKLKIVFVKIKSVLTFSASKKETYCKSIEQLAFQSMFEENIFLNLKNKWSESQWLFTATGVIFGSIYASIKILSQLL